MQRTEAKVPAGSREEPSDEELMKMLQGGDIRALAPLYERYRGVVNGVVRAQARHLNDSDAEDICHEVFLTLSEIAHRYRPGNPLRAWVCGIAMRKARRLGDGRSLRQRLLGRFFAPNVAAQAPRAEERHDVQRLIDQLSPPLREVVILSLVEQLSAEEVATALGIQVNTVWTRLHRAREQLRKLQGGEEP
jgi:RNA polymerase sigma-70 factor (ECF subfamily)